MPDRRSFPFVERLSQGRFHPGSCPRIHKGLYYGCRKRIRGRAGTGLAGQGRGSNRWISGQSLEDVYDGGKPKPPQQGARRIMGYNPKFKEGLDGSETQSYR
jgi:hypothetical protein